MNKETDLAKCIVGWLKEQNWDVWQEVQFDSFGPVNDIYAMKGKISWAIECKLTLNLKVIEQAYNSKAIIKTIAIPYRNYSTFAIKVCKDYGIGVITVSNSGNINYHPGKLNRQNYRSSNRIAERLKKIPQDYCIAGSKSGHWTPYKNTIDSVKKYIKSHQGCSFKDIMNNLDHHHYASDSTAKACIRKDLQKFESKWCKIEDNKYYYIGD